MESIRCPIDPHVRAGRLKTAWPCPVGIRGCRWRWCSWSGMVLPLGSLDRLARKMAVSTAAEAREARGVPVRRQATTATAECPDGWTEMGPEADVQARSGSRCKGLAMAATTKWVLHGEPWLEDSVCAWIAASMAGMARASRDRDQSADWCLKKPWLKKKREGKERGTAANRRLAGTDQTAPQPQPGLSATLA